MNPFALPVICCRQTTTHSPHEWNHYNIDSNRDELAWCTGDFLTQERPLALCHCGTPLVSTFEVAKKEWYCVKCEMFYEWLHARRGTGPNPSVELLERYEAAKTQYDAERAARLA